MIDDRSGDVGGQRRRWEKWGTEGKVDARLRITSDQFGLVKDGDGEDQDEVGVGGEGTQGVMCRQIGTSKKGRTEARPLR